MEPVDKAPRPPIAAPVVSVLMPVWNPDPGHLSVAIDSVLNQSLENLELVIVEDPSPVSAQQLVASFDDVRIRLHSNRERTGIIDQLNQGLSLCQAPLVARFDADDVCDLRRLEKQVAFLQSHPEISVLGTQLRVIDGQGREIGSRRYPLDHIAILRAMKRYNPLAHPTVMFRKDVVVENGAYQSLRGSFGAISWCQDYELWSRLAGQGVQFANVDEPLVSYRMHSEQVKSKNVRGVLEAMLQIKRRHWLEHMTRGERWRMRLEQALMFLPASFVLRLFHISQITKPKRPWSRRTR